MSQFEKNLKKQNKYKKMTEVGIVKVTKKCFESLCKIEEHETKNQQLCTNYYVH